MIKLISFHPIALPLYTYLHFAWEHIRHEALDSSGSHIKGIWLVLGHVVAEADEADGGHLGVGEAEELEDALVVVLLRVQVDEQNLEWVGWRFIDL